MKNITEILIGIIVALLFYFFQPAGAYGPFPQVMANVALIPIVATAIRLIKQKDLTTAIFTLVIYQTWNMFLQPYLWDEKVVATFRIVREEFIPAMSFYCMLSVWALYFGFNAYRSKKRDVKPFFPDTRMSQNRLSKLTGFAISAGVLISMMEFLVSVLGIRISFIGMLADMLPAGVLCLFSMYLIRGGRNMLLIGVVIVYTIYNFIYYIGGTLFIYSIILVSAPIAVYIVEKKKIPVLPIIIIAIALMPIYLSRHEYRREGLKASESVKIDVGLRILEDEYANFSFEKNKKRIEEKDDEMNVDNRFEGVSYLATIVYCHERLDYPWLYGKTFVWLPTLVVPRFLLPMRPSMNMGDKWAVYYKVKGADWDCSINFPMLVEFYTDFGYPGMVILSFLQGWLLAFICNLFNNGKGDYNLFILVLLMPKLIVIEANITLAYGLILQIIFVIWVLKKIYPTRKPLSPRPVHHRF